MTISTEQIGPQFARLVTEAAEDHGAGHFAADLAEMGANPDSLRVMAGRWREVGMEPAEFADDLREFADALES